MSYNPFSLEKKTILVTGASSGIGRSIAIECSKLGASVVVTGRNEKRLKETHLQMTGKHPDYLIADFSIPGDINMLVEKCSKIDGLVNCAGYTKLLPFQFTSKVDFEEIMNINFFAPTELTRLLVKSKKITKGASIVFISSISGVYVSAVASSLYSSSKGAINGLLKGIALDLSPMQIRVNSVNPGMIDTDIFSDGKITDDQKKKDMERYPLKRYGHPEEVAFAVIYLLSDASSWTTGSNILIDGGYTLL